MRLGRMDKELRRAKGVATGQVSQPPGQMLGDAEVAVFDSLYLHQDCAEKRRCGLLTGSCRSGRHARRH
jgi:hypothetical protein